MVDMTYFICGDILNTGISKFPIFIIPQLHDCFKGISCDTIFTVIVTISIFGLGIIIDRFLKNRSKKEKQQNVRQYFSTYVNKIKDSHLPALTTGYKNFIDSINIDSGLPMTPPRLMTGDLIRITDVDGTELLSAYNYNKSVISIIHYVDGINLLLTQIESFHKKVLKDSNTMRSRLEVLIDEYFNILSAYLDFEKNNSIDYDRDEVWILINESIIKYHTQLVGKRSLKQFYTDILRPIQEKIVNMNYFRTKPLGERVALMGKEISLLYYRIDDLCNE